MTDLRELVERCRRGDRSAFREIFAAHRSDVARLVYRMLGPQAPDLEDVVQEVFLQVHRSLRDFRGESKLSTWIHRIAVNVVLMHQRAVRSRPRLVASVSALPPIDSTMGPDEDVSRRRRIRAFFRVLDRLSEKKRTVFVLCELEGMSPAEVAKVIDTPVLTVRTRLFYARRELAQLLREEPELAAYADAFGRVAGGEGSRPTREAKVAEEMR